MAEQKIVSRSGTEIGVGKQGKDGAWIAMGEPGSRCEWLDRTNAVALRDALTAALEDG